MPVSARFERRVRRGFREPGRADHVVRLLGELPEAAGYDPGTFASERVQAAVVLLAGGDVLRFGRAARFASRDWRDLLATAGLLTRTGRTAWTRTLARPPRRRPWRRR